MKKIGKKCLSVLLTIVMLLGMLPTVALAAPPSGTITAYLYYKVNGQVPADRNNDVQYNDTTQSNYGPSGDNTPMLAVEIDVDELLEISKQANSPVEFGDPNGRYPEWYFRPVSADDADVQAFWEAVQKCMTAESRAALAATGMGESFVCYMLKRNGYDSHGYYVHMDGVLKVSTEDNTDVYVCELYDENEVYIGGLVTDSTKNASEDPTLAEVYDVYEAHFGMPTDTVWTPVSDGASATYIGADGNRYLVTVYQTNVGGTLYKPHDSSEISYKMKDDNYYIAIFGMDREALPYTVTYTDGLADRVAFKDEVYTGLYYGATTPAFTGGTPEDPQQKLVFTGWSPAVAHTVTGDVTYVAQWEEEKFTVTWLDDDGTELETDTNVANGTAPTYDGATPTKTGDAEYSYEFIGWTPAVTPVDGADQVYTAVYHPVLNTYTVTWVDADNTELEVDKNVAYGTLPTYDGAGGTTAELASAKNTVRYTYRFAGWTPAVDFVTGDITYTAAYTRTTNTYTVTWIDYNGNVLGTDTVEYGDQPEYIGTEPSRVPTAQYTYTFDGWKNTDGTDDTVYASDGNFPAVTGNVTYQAQYTPEQRSYTVTLKLYLDNALANSVAVHGTALIPYISADNGNTLYESEHDTTGTYVVENVPNGVYGIYNAAGNSLCEQIIVVENGDVEKACYYYTVSYVGNGADSGVPADEAYHLGDAVSVEDAPVRDGYIFRGWKSDGTVLQPGDTLTASIAKTYTLEAQWEKTVNVTVNVHLDHTTGSVGRDVNDEKDDVTIELVWRPDDDSAPWLEVPGTVKKLDSGNHDGFSYQITPTGAVATEVTQTVYAASAVTYSNVDGGNGTRKFSVTYDKTNYVLDTTKGTGSSGITAVKDGSGDWTIDLYLKYTTSNFDLEFSVEMDSSVPKTLYPDAVIARVLYWDGDSWEIISQHDSGKSGVNVPINNSGIGMGKYSVWQANTATPPVPYGYRFEVSAFVYDGNIVPYTSGDLSFYTDGTYTAAMGPVADGQQYGGAAGLFGAYYDETKAAQQGTLHAVITVPAYQVVLDGNGGTFAGSPTKTYKDLIKMPNVSGDVPAHAVSAAYIFDGYDWYEDADSDGVYDVGEVPAAEVAAGEKLEKNYVLVARWKSPWTVKGDITVDATYKLGGETKIIQDADRIRSVTVLLQYAPAGTTTFTNKRTETVTITYAGDNDGTGSYEFKNVPNDGGTWRVHVLNHNYTTTYQNENSSVFAPENDLLTGPSIAVDVNADLAAEVDVKMSFDPVTFDLYYKVIADDIGASFRPTNAEVLVLYDATAVSESPRLWPVISQMQDGAGYTGATGAIGTEHSYPVWINHPLGHLYDYAIKVEAVDSDDLIGNEPYTVEYNGSAEYLASGGYKNQTQLLTAALKPKAYPVKYYLYEGSTVELHAMKDGAPIQVSSHTWSFDTELKNGSNWKDVPARSGWVFTGWVDASGTPVTSIGAAVQAETKLYATWEEDNWKDDPSGDSPTGGDGIPDSQQVRIVYTTDGHGTTDPLGEIVTITGGAYTDKVVTGDGSEATALTGYAYDGWAYVGSSDSSDNATAALSVLGTTLKPTISNADGGKTYTFKVSFAEDHWKDNPSGNDAPTGGDGIPDKYQAVVEFHSANTSHGTVSGNVYQVTTFAGKATTGTVVPSLTGVTVNALTGWAFDYWIKGSGTDKLQAAGVEQPIDNVAGGTVIKFYANFAIDEWKDDPSGDSPTGGDGIPDYRQALVTYIPAANGRGKVEGKNAVQVFTLPDGEETINIIPAKDDLTVTPNSGYAFDYWSDLEGFWGTAGAKLTDEQPFQLHANVPGGAIITYVAHFDTDSWDKDNGSETGGDGIPDAKQVLIRYASNDTAKGTVSPTVEVISLTEGEKKGPENISSDKIAGSTATALSGNAFDYWYSSRSNVSFTASAKTVDPAIYGARGGEIYTFTAAFGPDIVGGEGGGDGIPDVYQKVVTFKVVNGDWSDGTDADLTVYVTLMKDGKWDLNGSGTLTAPAVGNLPDDGYKAGGWDVTPPTTVTNTLEETYTYEYAPLDNYTITVNYLEEGIGTELKTPVTASAVEGGSYDVSAQIPETLTSGGKNYVKVSVTGDPISGTADGSKTVTVYYAVDELIDPGKDPDPTVPGDGIPDKYQKQITFKVVNGDWNDGTDADLTVCVTLMKGGMWDVTGSAALTAPAVGNLPDGGYKAGSWDVTPPTTVTGTSTEVYTYTYLPLGNFGITVNYLEEGTNAVLQTSVTVPVVESKPYDVSAQIPETLTHGGKNYVKVSVTGDPISGTADGSKTVTVYYAVDELIDPGKDPDPTVPGDGIPDKYQKQITFKVVNGNWNDVTDADQTVCVTLMKGGMWDVTGSAALTAPAVGNLPDGGYKAGSWDVTPPATVTGTSAEVYTYTYLPLGNFGITVNYLEEGTNAVLQTSVTVPVVESKPYDVSAQVPETLTSGGKNYVKVSVTGDPISGTADGSKTVTVYYAVDELIDPGKDPDPTVPGDSIPDKYQKQITFKVVNGNWNDGTDVDQTVCVTLMKGGMWDVTGSAALTAPAVGNLPDGGYKAGSWDVTPPTTVTGTSAEVYTYTYLPLGNFGITVNYLEEGTNAVLQASVTVPVVESKPYDVSAQIPETLTYGGKNYVKVSVTGDPISGTADGSKTVTVYYAMDELIDPGKDPDPTVPGDGIPDKYQKQITFKVVNGDWNDGTDADQTVCVTLMKGGMWDVTGSAALTAPAVGNLPDGGYKAGSWDVTPPATVTGTSAEVYTYTYLPLGNFGITVNYLEEGTNAVLQTSVTVPVVESKPYDVSAQIPEALTHGGKNYVKVSVTGDSISGTADGSKTVTVYYAVDELIDPGKDPDPTVPGDSIPDKYQKQITFKVVNGDWNDGTDADLTVCVTLMKGGMWDVTGSAALTAPAVGNLPDGGYKAGGWDVTPPATVTGTSAEEYTYTYLPLGNFGITVNYLEEGTNAVLQASVTVPVVESKPYDVSAQIPETLTHGGKNYVKVSVTGDSISGTADGSKTVTVYYAVDELIDPGKDPDPTVPGDGIPDKYQKQITFKVVNGNWNDGTDADLTVYVTLMKGGMWDVTGSAALTAPAVGNLPDGGYKAGGWDVTPPATVTGTSAEVYTYTYKKISVPPTPDIPSTSTVTLTKVDAVDALTTLSGVVFELYRANGTLMGTYTTGADGTITVSNLLAGKYYWVEIRPAEGYLLDASKHEFTVFGGRDAEISISNTRTPVPDVFSGDHYAYIIGRGDGLVHPEAYITRAEVATIFFRLLDDATREQYMTKENSFSDVEKGMWFNAAVSTMAAMGIVNGYPDGDFHPNDYITRAQFAAIAARFDVAGNTTNAIFTDIYDHWAQREINVAYNNGWILGYEDGSFRPDQNITRAEAITMINRVLQRVPEHKTDLLPDMVQWPDNMAPSKWYYLAIQEATNSHDYGRKESGYEYWTGLKEVRDWSELER